MLFFFFFFFFFFTSILRPLQGLHENIRLNEGGGGGGEGGWKSDTRVIRYGRKKHILMKKKKQRETETDERKLQLNNNTWVNYNGDYTVMLLFYSILGCVHPLPEVALQLSLSFAILDHIVPWCT